MLSTTGTCAALAATGFRGRQTVVGIDLGTTFSVVGVNEVRHQTLSCTPVADQKSPSRASCWMCVFVQSIYQVPGTNERSWLYEVLPAPTREASMLCMLNRRSNTRGVTSCTKQTPFRIEVTLYLVQTTPTVRTVVLLLAHDDSPAEISILQTRSSSLISSSSRCRRYIVPLLGSSAPWPRHVLKERAILEVSNEHKLTGWPTTTYV